MKITHKLYIGENNEDGTIDFDIIAEIVGAHYEAFIMYVARGFWKGGEERTAVIEISADKDDDVISDLVTRLKSDLKQEAIGYQQLPPIGLM